MKSLRLIGVVSLVVGAVCLTAAFASQDKGKDVKAKPASAPAGMDPEMMAKMAAFSTPGPDHKVLDPLVGKWTTHVKMWMDPAGPAMEADGTDEFKWILGSRFLEDTHKSTAMGQPFEGKGTLGYDNLKKKYVSTWVDTMSTGIMESEGTYDAAKKAFTYTTLGPDAAMNKYVPMRIVDTMVDANTFKMEMFGPDASGKEYKSLEIVYTRAK